MSPKSSTSAAKAGLPAASADAAKLRSMANAVRALSIDAVEAAKSGHPGLPLGAADVATVLFTQFLKFDPTMPDWADRDRFVLSAGHGSMLLYALLHLTGYEDMRIEDIRNFRQLGSRAAGHPEYGLAAGIETTTGPLGQGLATAVGMAIAERHLAAIFGSDVVDHKTYVLAGDGDMMEGVSQEAIALAGHLKLSKLIVLFDDNGITIDGPVSLAESGDQLARFRAAGWDTLSVDGHDADAIALALQDAQNNERPTLIACKTVIGYGAPTKRGTSGAHGSPLGGAEAAATKEALGWTAAPFEIPSDIRDAWRLAGLRGVKTRKAWEKRLADLPSEHRAEFERRMRGDLPASLENAVAGYMKQLAKEPKTVATRKASEMALEVLANAMPEMIGGSADLTGSNNTRTKSMKAITPDDFANRFIHYGIREHGMAAAMNGMALHGGVIPYSGTFLVFSDYCRPAMRLSALMRQRVIYVMTHDSIGLGEDGPTHQPVEHLASLRAIPNMLVFRPADVVETMECWQLALQHDSSPSVLALTRQNLPQLREGVSSKNMCASGGYVLRQASDEAKVVLIATGSEVAIAIEAQQLLEQDGIATSVVSMPCCELFDRQSQDYRNMVLPAAAAKVAIEAAGPMGWHRYTGADGAIIAMNGFGESAPFEELYRHFGITAEAAALAAKRCLSDRQQDA